MFIDIGIPVGIDWAQEIALRIDWCDFLVVLLSTESVQSEMVQGEVRLAHQRRKADGRPRILPIRVSFDGPLDYELDSYLARIQHLAWSGPDDTASILAALTAANQDRSELTTSSVSSAEAFPAASGRPLPSVDPRQLRKMLPCKASSRYLYAYRLPTQPSPHATHLQDGRLRLACDEHGIPPRLSSRCRDCSALNHSPGAYKESVDARPIGSTASAYWASSSLFRARGAGGSNRQGR